MQGSSVTASLMAFLRFHRRFKSHASPSFLVRWPFDQESLTSTWTPTAQENRLQRIKTALISSTCIHFLRLLRPLDEKRNSVQQASYSQEKGHRWATCADSRRFSREPWHDGAATTL